MGFGKKYGKMMLALIIGSFFVFLSAEAPKVSASETRVEADALLRLLQDTTLMEEADEASAPVAELLEGTTVISVEASADGWIKVQYQGKTGYIPLNSGGLRDNEGLDEEFEQLANEYRLIFEVIEYKQTQSRQNLIWGIVIAALVVAVFAVGIASAVMGGQKTARKNR